MAEISISTAGSISLDHATDLGSPCSATDVLGDLDKGCRWLTSPNRALGGKAPLDLLDTDIGRQQVHDVLTRLNHGLFS